MEDIVVSQDGVFTPYEDVYAKFDCQECKRKFIVGETMSEGRDISCPYCRSQNIISVTNSGDRDMNMGCMAISYHKYPDGSLMLYTEKELYDAEKKEPNIIPLPLSCISGYWYEIMLKYCAERDKKSI